MNHQLVIITPTKRSEYLVNWVEIETTSGNQIIQPDRAPLIALLKPSNHVTFELADGKQEVVEIWGGIVEVTRKETTIIADQPS